MKGYRIIKAQNVKDHYEGKDVPGEFRRFTDPLGSEQLALSLIRIPPHSDFEQGTGHSHTELEEVYIITSGTLTMRFDDEIVKVPAGSAVVVAPQTSRSHRNESNEWVDIWAISRKIDHADFIFIKEFWEASPKAVQKRKRPFKR